MTDPLAARRSFVQLGGASALLALAGCAQWLGPRWIEVPEQRLQEALARRFPLGRRLGEGGEIRLDGPRLSLLPASNRVALSCDVRAGEGLLRRPVAGALALSFGLAFDAANHVLRAVDVRIDVLRLDGLDTTVGRVIERVTRPLAEGLLEGQPIYALRPRDLERLQSAGLAPGAIVVTASSVVIELVPAGR